MEIEHEDMLNQRDNETKILIATMQMEAKVEEDDGIQTPEYSQEAKDRLMEQMREFDARLNLDRDKFEFEKHKAKVDAQLKEKQIAKSHQTAKK